MDTARPQPYPDSPPTSIAPDALYRMLGGPHCPLIVDVRKPSAFDGDDSMLPGALRMPPEAIDEWSPPASAKAIVVYCVHGHEVSQNAARALASRGYRALFLDGGVALWREIGLPLMRKSVLADAVRSNAIAYDIPGAPLEHDGDHCSFDAFIKAFGLKDPALDDLATIIRAADTGRPDLSPQAHGLLAVSLGLSHNFSDDRAMLEHGFVLYDALYAWCRHARDERHNWTPQPVASA